MKYIKSKKISKQRYELTLEVSDYDLEMFEDFATTYAPNEIVEDASEKNDWNEVYSPDYKYKYRKWMLKVWSTFWECWHKQDEISQTIPSTENKK